MCTTILFGRTEGGRVMGVVVHIVMAGGAGVLQFLDVEPMRNGDVVGVDLWGGLLHVKNPLVAADAVRIDLVQLRRKACVLAPAFEGKDVDAGRQGVAGRVTLRAVDFGMEGRLLPEGGFPLPLMTGDTKLLLGRGIGRQGDRRINAEDDQNASQGPGPERKTGQLEIEPIQPIPPLP